MAKSDSVRVSDINGWYEVPGNPISKVGVFQYLGKSIPGADPDRIYNVYRSAEELGSAATLESIRLCPWIDNHVMLGDSEKGLTPAEDKTVHGVTGEKVYFQEDVLYANLKMFSQTLAKLIADGKNELSLGYRCKYVLAPGVYNGQEYEYVQVDIRANHLALVDEGRMGADVAVLDHFVFTFDAKELKIMADPTENAGEGGAEMSLTDAIKAVNGLLPVLMKLAGLPGAGAAGACEVDPAADPAEVADPALVNDEETEEEKAAREAKEKAAPAKAGDAEPDDKDKKDTAAMDAAIARHLRSAPNVAAVVKAIAQRDKLAAQLSEHVGTFDHSEMTIGQVAAYGVKKLKITASAGQESAVLAGYMQAAKSPASARVATSHGFDAVEAPKSNFVSAFLEGK